MIEEDTPKKTPAPRVVDQAQPEKPQRRKKAPPIDFNRLDDRDRKLLQNIATTGARVAGRQQKLRDGQLAAMRDTLPDMLADAEEAEPDLLKQWFEMMIAAATPANAKKIAAHPLCPAELADSYRRRG